MTSGLQGPACLTCRRQEGYLVALPVHRLAEIQDCRVLDPCGQDMLFLRREFQCAHEGCIVAFSAAAREDYFARSALIRAAPVPWQPLCTCAPAAEVCMLDGLP